MKQLRQGKEKVASNENKSSQESKPSSEVVEEIKEVCKDLGLKKLSFVDEWLRNGWSVEELREVVWTLRIKHPVSNPVGFLLYYCPKGPSPTRTALREILGPEGFPIHPEDRERAFEPLRVQLASLRRRLDLNGNAPRIYRLYERYLTEVYRRWKRELGKVRETKGGAGR